MEDGLVSDQRSEQARSTRLLVEKEKEIMRLRATVSAVMAASKRLVAEEQRSGAFQVPWIVRAVLDAAEQIEGGVGAASPVAEAGA